MNQKLREEANIIIKASIEAVLPDRAVWRALSSFNPGSGKVILVAVGKAAWQMASAAMKMLGRVDEGIVLTKYGHVMGEIPGVLCFEAGHPVPDKNSFLGTERILNMVRGLTKDDTVLLLLSGGGSALLEKPLIPPDELFDITKQLLSCGANISEMNTIRKRLSGVKGGRLALACEPAQVFSIALSDVLGDSPDLIASGPTCPDTSTCEQAKIIIQKYDINLSELALRQLEQETPKELLNVKMQIAGSVRELCDAAAQKCGSLGYETLVLTDQLSCEAKEAGRFLSAVLETHARSKKRMAFIAGGETVVHLSGNGLGGRNQELVLAAARGIAGMPNAAIFSIGSDGTDGPTDAAGGYVDGDTLFELKQKNIDAEDVLKRNDSYHALAAIDSLIITGPTGTNVNDVAVGLLQGVV